MCATRRVSLTSIEIRQFGQNFGTCDETACVFRSADSGFHNLQDSTSPIGLGVVQATQNTLWESDVRR